MLKNIKQKKKNQKFKKKKSKEKFFIKNEIKKK